MGENGYIYILGHDGTLLGHPSREGESLWESTDSSGKYFIREVRDRALEGGGFTYYDFELPDQSGIAPKLIYSKLEPNWDWIIASGTYMKDFNAPVNDLVKMIIATLVFSGIMGGIVSVVFSRHLVSPIKRLSIRLRKIANGDLTIPNGTKRREDEVGMLYQGVNQMATQLKTLITDVEQTIHEIQMTSSNLTAVAEETTALGESIVKAVEEVAAGAAQQASDTEQTTMATTDFATHINILQDKNEDINASSSNMRQANKQGLENLQQLQESSEQSNELMLQVQKVFNNLMQKLAEVEGIVGTINEISDQTNLLALNASIEAARAGEHGKGFAVVAEEVRKLADQTQEATKSVRETLRGIETETDAVTSEMEKAAHIVQQQRDAVLTTQHSFESIEQAVENISTVIRDTARSMEQLTQSKNKMLISMESIAAVSEKNAASTEEVTASIDEQQRAIELVTNSANELTNEINTLQEAIHKFTIR